MGLTVGWWLTVRKPDAELEGPTPRKRGREEERKRGREEERKRVRKEERKRGREEERKRGRLVAGWLVAGWLVAVAGGWASGYLTVVGLSNGRDR